ncbi:Leucine-rich repeat - like 10 [Theobroma cacao]|nr:Leucine-rich repeat - like 10 [Theobroma cacao]
MSKVVNLDLSRNFLKGSIPPSINKMENLSFLDLSSNDLSGIIPSQLQGSRKLMVLDLSKNNLSGGVPSSLCSLPSLIFLKLSSNNLSGELSTTLQNCSGLLSIDLGENRFSGTIPDLVSDNLFFLSYLGLRANILTGSIPEQLCKFPNLHIIDLAQNNLSGAIPECLGKLEAFTYLGPYFNELPSTQHISFSQHVEIVSKGPIPPSMSSMTLLNYLNLSFNNLSGQIPSSNQFQTFNDPSIYQGNPELCGPPLSTSCSSPRNGYGEDKNGDLEGEDRSEKLWFYTSMALGFATGFWVVCGSLVIKRSWRQAYFKFVDEMKDRLFVVIAVRIARFRKKVVGGS